MADSLLLKNFQKKADHFDLPLQSNEQPVSSAPIVLVIENHDDTRSLLKAFLESQGYRVAEATDGEQVLELFEDGTLDLDLPDLVLTETVLPGVDGLAVISKLRMFTAFAQIPVVFLSSRAEASLKSKALELGGNDFLIKPIELKFLEQTLDKYLEGNQIKPRHCADGNLNVNGGSCS